MNLTSPSQVKAWCIEHDFHPNKILGQNFLIDRNALEAIVRDGLEGSGCLEGLEVLEIGPGLGVLTEELLKRGCRVTAVEKDPVLAARLAEALGNPEGLAVVAGDALAWIARQTAKPSQPFSSMVSNLPYQAGTRILLELTRRRQIARMTVLVQTEVAERLAAGPGSKTRGLAGVWAQLDYDVKIVRKVSPSCFWPRPEIGSSVVRLTRHNRNVGLNDEEREFFFRLTKKAFEHRRKQLGSVFKDMIQSTARAEELSNEDWVALVKRVLGKRTDEHSESQKGTEDMQTPQEFLKANGFVSADEIDRQEMISTFLSEMDKGLKGEESSLMMIPTYVGVNGRIPEGAKAAVLDAGGTNFRGGIVTIPPAITDKQNQPMPGTKGEVDEDAFYSAFAAEVKRIEGKATVKKIGWCFSYAAEATPELDARLVRWTKNIQAPSIVGQYVGKELLKRLGGGEIAIVNDTVATLLAAKATEGDKTYSSYLGFILGTGTNTAYVEKNANIKKLAGLDPNGTMIINAESGGFTKLQRSTFDIAADAKTGNPGFNFLEKMIAGGFLGGVGLEIYKGAAKAGMFSAKAASAIGGVGALETMDFDNFCAGYKKEGRDNVLDAIFADADDAKMARRLGIPVFERAAVLTAIHLAAFCIKSGEGADASAPIAINADGSTYYKTRAIPFAETVTKELDDMLVKRRNIHYEITPQVEDAPMIGAGIAAML